MDYIALIELVSRMGTQLATSGAETYRVEESIVRILEAYGQKGQAYCVPNSLLITISVPNQLPVTKLCRMPERNNDIDAVELYSNLSRRICAETPELSHALQWVQEAEMHRRHYGVWVNLLGYILVAAGFCFFFGGNGADCLCAAGCGLLLGVASECLKKLEMNHFFRQILFSFIMSGSAYLFACTGLTRNVDTVVIGTIMLLVPGLLFTNGIRDVIFGDTNSGINRIVESLLIASAVALGTAVAWNLVNTWLGIPSFSERLYHADVWTCLACFAACFGFVILFNIHGSGNILCATGGALTWATYCLASNCGVGYLTCCLVSTMVSAAFAEAMARVRKYPAISYMIIAVLPLIPGSHIYYAALEAVQGNMDGFVHYGMQTLGTAGAMALGILLVSTSVRMWRSFRKLWRSHK